MSSCQIQRVGKDRGIAEKNEKKREKKKKKKKKNQKWKKWKHREAECYVEHGVSGEKKGSSKEEI